MVVRAEQREVHKRGKIKIRKQERGKNAECKKYSLQSVSRLGGSSGLGGPAFDSGQPPPSTADRPLLQYFPVCGARGSRPFFRAVFREWKNQGRSFQEGALLLWNWGVGNADQHSDSKTRPPSGDIFPELRQCAFSVRRADSAPPEMRGLLLQAFGAGCVLRSEPASSS